jgi:hypothetical protein
MADMAQAVVTGGTALVSAAAGAGLTYWLGALNRRHQEAREDRTRWYEKRLQAYIELHQATYDALFTTLGTQPSAEVSSRVWQRLVNAIGAIRFVGSPEVIEAAEKVHYRVTDEMTFEEVSGKFLDALVLQP